MTRRADGGAPLATSETIEMAGVLWHRSERAL